jgi:hypothetical protein
MPKQHKLFVLALFLAFVSAHVTMAQQADTTKAAAADSTKATADTTKVKHKNFFKTIWRDYPYPDPRKAMILSAVLPGAGQFYNKRWWKAAIVYAGLATATYFIVTNQQQYNFYHAQLVLATNGEPYSLSSVYNASDLYSIQGYYSNYRDISVISAALIYIIGIVDANVDAQLHNFDVSDNLSFHFTPHFSNDLGGKYSLQPGFSLVKRF